MAGACEAVGAGAIWAVVVVVVSVIGSASAGTPQVRAVNAMAAPDATVSAPLTIRPHPHKLDGGRPGIGCLRRIHRNCWRPGCGPAGTPLLWPWLLAVSRDRIDSYSSRGLERYRLESWRRPCSRSRDTRQNRAVDRREGSPREGMPNRNTRNTAQREGRLDRKLDRALVRAARAGPRRC
jgi:hypothetical protein